VIGSDILGPMGKELIPFEKEADAKAFMRDHRGKAILKFTEVTAATLKELE
jgi:copper chaperone NosL